MVSGTSTLQNDDRSADPRVTGHAGEGCMHYKRASETPAHTNLIDKLILIAGQHRPTTGLDDDRSSIGE